MSLPARDELSGSAVNALGEVRALRFEGRKGKETLGDLFGV